MKLYQFKGYNMPNRKECAGCFYWDEHTLSGRSGIGFCHRYPPSNTLGNVTHNGFHIFVPINTFAASWCGEWVSKMDHKVQPNSEINLEEIQKKIVKVLSMKNEDIVWSARVTNALKENNVTTILDLVQYTEHDVLLFRGLGPHSLLEIRMILSNLGLKLKKG